jgi:hypothetical protein
LCWVVLDLLQERKDYTRAATKCEAAELYDELAMIMLAFVRKYAPQVAIENQISYFTTCYVRCCVVCGLKRREEERERADFWF